MPRVKFVQFEAPGGPLPLLRCSKAAWLQGRTGASCGRSARPAAKGFATSGVPARSLRQKKIRLWADFFLFGYVGSSPFQKLVEVGFGFAKGKVAGQGKVVFPFVPAHPAVYINGKIEFGFVVGKQFHNSFNLR